MNTTDQLSNHSNPASKPVAQSYVARAMAQDKTKVKLAIKICHQAWRQAPENPEVAANLAYVHLMAGNRRTAHRVLRQATVSEAENIELQRLSRRMGERKDAVFNTLPRNHIVNRCFGYLRHRLLNN